MRNKNENGFSLIELLIVLAIIGILAAIIIPRLGGSNNQNYQEEAKGALEAQGFNFVQVESTSVQTTFSGCSESDGVAVTALSTNTRCDLVRHVVCLGGPLSYKAATVRGGEVVQKNYPGCVIPGSQPTPSSTVLVPLPSPSPTARYY